MLRAIKCLKLNLFSRCFENYKKLFGKKGYVSATALVTMLLVMAFAGGMLGMASYNYANSVSRHHEKQVYFYARSFIAQSEDKILDGDINENLVEVVLDVEARLNAINPTPHPLKAKYAGKYAEKYTVRASLGESADGDTYNLKNPSSPDLVSLEMDIRYFPKGSDNTLPIKITSGAESVNEIDVVRVGDLLEIKYTVRLVDVKKRPIAYVVTTTYRCSNDASKNPDGTQAVDTDGNLVVKTVEHMKWHKESDMGEHIYE